MELTEGNSDESDIEEVLPKKRFQFSLLSYLTAITLFSISAGPILHFGGIEELGFIAFVALLLLLLCGSAHMLAEWILTPSELRPRLFVSAWFWFALGFVLFTTTMGQIEKLSHSSDFESGKPSWELLCCLALGTAFCYAMGVLRLRQRLRRPAVNQ